MIWLIVSALILELLIVALVVYHNQLERYAIHTGKGIQIGDYHFTARECLVLRLICEGHGNKAIAVQLLISEQTVKNHVSALFAKTQSNNRTELALKLFGKFGEIRSGG